MQFGSEPLFDQVLSPPDLIKQVQAAQKNLSSLQIPVTVSDLAYSFGQVCDMSTISLDFKLIFIDLQLHANDGGPDVLKAVNLIDAHMLPFFSTLASTG